MIKRTARERLDDAPCRLEEDRTARIITYNDTYRVSRMYSTNAMAFVRFVIFHFFFRF